MADELRRQVAQVFVDSALGGEGAGLTGRGGAEAGQAHVGQLGLQGGVQQDVAAGRRREGETGMSERRRGWSTAAESHVSLSI